MSTDILFHNRLFVERIKTHPQFIRTSAEDKKLMKPLVKSSMERATELKRKLLEKYEEEKKTEEEVGETKCMEERNLGGVWTKCNSVYLCRPSLHHSNIRAREGGGGAGCGP